MQIKDLEYYRYFKSAVAFFFLFFFTELQLETVSKAFYGNATTNYGSYEGKTKVDDQYFPQSVIDFSNGDRTSENDHPTQKPLDLIRYLIQTFSNENELVFDGYMGSGTTAHACILEKRNFIGAEMNK
jgi:site-specific DNA-methyltransferase (adenine-specific)